MRWPHLVRADRPANKRTRPRQRRLGLVIILLAAFAGCGPLQDQDIEAARRKAFAESNSAQILALSSDLSDPHKVLGEVIYNEPFSPEAIDTDHINNKLRQLAIDRYHDDVDAIVNVASDVNQNGTVVSASAQAVEVIGPCSYCRHKELIVVSEINPQARQAQAPHYEVGETWIIKVNDTEGNIEVKSVSPYKVVMNWLGHENTYTPEGNLIAGYLYAQKGYFDPNLGTFAFPLKAGKRWAAEWMLKTEYGKLLGNTHAQAMDWEKITVPLGTFDALKIKIDYLTAVFGLEMTCWYAPDLKLFVKCETSHPDFKTMDLLSYRPSAESLTH